MLDLRRKNTISYWLLFIVSAVYRFRNRRFYSLNCNFWRSWRANETKNNRIVLAELNANIYGAYGIAVIATLLAKKHEARVAYLMRAKINGKLPPLYYYLKQIVSLASMKWLRDSFTDNLQLSVDDIIQLQRRQIQDEASRLYALLKTPDDLLELKYKGMFIGDLVYDASMRCGEWQATVWKIDERVYQTIYDAVSIIRALEHIDSCYEVRAVTTSHFIGLWGIVPRYFANKKVESYVGIAGAGPIRKHLKFNGKRLPYDASLDKAMIERIMNDEGLRREMLEKAETYIEDRISGKLLDLDSRRAFSKEKKEYIDPREFCKNYGLDPGKKCVFVMLHAFNDFPHHFEKNLFRDYYIWFRETLEIARKLPDVNWIFKEHPSSKFYPSDANLKGIFENVREENILFLDWQEPFSSASLRHVALAIVTCVGTAGLEFSCFGVPAVLAGENHFSGLGICYEPKTYKEYEETLKNIRQVTELPTHLQELAKIVFYIQYNYLFGSNNNNDLFLPRSSHEEKMRNDQASVLNYIVEQFSKPETKDKLEELNEYIMDKNREIYFRDKRLARMELSTIKEEA